MAAKLVLVRYSDDGKRTLGILFGLPNLIHTLEEPWKDNKKGVSCIPEGAYKVVPHGWNGEPVKFKQAYRLEGTTPRKAILIHAGNTTDDIEGCILVGMSKGQLREKDAVLASRPAMNYIRSIIGNNAFELQIESK